MGPVEGMSSADGNQHKDGTRDVEAGMGETDALLKQDSKASPSKEKQDRRPDLEFRVDCLFWSRCLKLLSMGFGWPWRNPLTWLFMLSNLATTICAARTLQYGLRPSTASLLACLQNGCEGVPAPGPSAKVFELILDYLWHMFLLISLLGLNKVLGEMVCTRCRDRVGRTLQRKLFTGRTLYHLVVMDGRIDNYDQCLTTDLQMFFDSLIGLLMGSVSYYVLFPFFLQLPLVYIAVSILREGAVPCAMEVTIAFFFFALLVFALPMNRVAKIFYLQQQYEGDLRFSHSRVVTHCESIAFYGGERREKKMADRHFTRLYHKLRAYFQYQGVLLVLQNILHAYATGSVPLLLLALMGPVANDYRSLLRLDQQLVSAFLGAVQMPLLYSKLGSVAGACHRVGKLMEVTEELAAKNTNEAMNVVNCDHVSLEKVTIKVAGMDESPIFKDLSLSVKDSQHLIIMGPSGCGKSSLLRVIAGLWHVDKGTVKRPLKIGRGGIFFVPQRVYLCQGTLRQQLMYPDDSRGIGVKRDKELLALLDIVALRHVADRYGLDSPFDWDTVLSVGEKQRLGFARLFWHQPRYALLDEATSALDVEMEKKCLETCTYMNITLISVAHRPQVMKYHNQLLKYDVETDEWIQRPITPEDGLLPADLTQASIYESAPLTPASPLEKEVKRMHLKQGQRERVGGSERRGKEAFPPARLDYRFLRRFSRMLGMAIPRLRSKPGWFLFVILVCFPLEAAVVMIGAQYLGPSKLVEKIFLGHTREALMCICLLLIVGAVQAFLLGSAAYAGVRIALLLQKAVAKELHNRYFVKKVHFALTTVDKSLDSIDQRMVQDLSGLGMHCSWVLGSPHAFSHYRRGILGSIILLCFYLPFALKLSWSMVALLCGFTCITITLQTIAASPVASSVAKRQEAEGELRSHHTRIRAYCESIAFYGGQMAELETADLLLTNVYRARLKFLARNALALYLVLLSSGSSIGLPYVIAAVIQHILPIGHFNPKDTDTVVRFMNTVAGDIILTLGAVNGLAQLAGYVTRVSEVLEKANRYRNFAADHERHIIPSKVVRYQHITLYPPHSERLLIRDLNLKIAPQKSVVIMGPSGCGKSSILRVLAGLWAPAVGTVESPQVIGTDGIFFVAQTSYITQGTLREQIIYPDTIVDQALKPGTRVANDAIFLQLLDDVGLSYLYHRWGLDSNVTWDEILSGGEQQRLGFARMFYHKPAYVAMDECTSALDVELEAKCLRACVSRGITMISVAHRPTVIPFHSLMLKIDGRGGYGVYPISSPKPKPGSSKITEIPDDVKKMK